MKKGDEQMRTVCKDCGRLTKSSRSVIDKDGTPICLNCAYKKYDWNKKEKEKK